MQSTDQGERAIHRTGIDQDDNGTWWSICTCGWRRPWHFQTAARREAKAHKRYPDGNPRLAALDEKGTG